MENKKHIVFLTGAGISAESGISTFRDADGLWEKYPVKQVASIQGYREDRELVIDFYNSMRKNLANVEPNDGHKLIVELEKHFKVSVITQNVDDLHERAGSSDITHLHGELLKITSTRNPNDEKCIRKVNYDHEIKIGDKAADGSQERPFIVWFGEAVPNLKKAAEICSTADIFVIVGTSLAVYPAAMLVFETQVDTPVYIIDPNDVPVNGFVATHIKKGASEGMKELLERLLNVENQ